MTASQPATDTSTDRSEGRIPALDLIRGVAVLGILAINIGGFAGPSLSTISPHLPFAGSHADEIAFAVKFVLFEGKMRALFGLLFGASLLLHLRRADEAGRFGIELQARRLGWLALFGLAHFYLFWWGDILFLYAVAGLIAMTMNEARPRTLLIFAAAVFAIWHGVGALESEPRVAQERRVLAGIASPSEVRDYASYRAHIRQSVIRELDAVRGGFPEQAKSRIVGETFQPLTGAFESLGETLPLMLLGMVLLQSGFFAGRWPRRSLLGIGAAGIVGGGAMTGAILAGVWPRGFPPAAMQAAFLYWTAVPHLLMALGYGAMLVVATPRLIALAPGRWLAAAGRTAFTNYIGATLLMTGIFYGWGLGWIGRFGHAWQWLFVLLGWAAMLVFSNGWLTRFRRGPLEWLWRSLVEGSMLRNRR